MLVAEFEYCFIGIVGAAEFGHMVFIKHVNVPDVSEGINSAGSTSNTIELVLRDRQGGRSVLVMSKLGKMTMRSACSTFISLAILSISITPLAITI
jgi:hypothetical protein